MGLGSFFWVGVVQCYPFLFKLNTGHLKASTYMYTNNTVLSTYRYTFIF